MATKHRVILTLDADQLYLLHRGLASLQHNDPEYKLHVTDPQCFPKLCSILLMAKEVCENRDRADEAERQLSQLALKSITQ